MSSNPAEPGLTRTAPSETEQVTRPALSETERVTRLLRDQIVDGVRAPGSRLVERELAASLDVSRVPVREALQTLASEGLVTPRPRSWAVVRTFTDRDLLDLVEVRSAIEVLTVRLAAERRTAEQLDAAAAALEFESDRVLRRLVDDAGLRRVDKPGVIRRAVAGHRGAACILAPDDDCTDAVDLDPVGPTHSPEFDGTRCTSV